MLGMVRLYIEPREGIPEGHVPRDYSPVIDCHDQEMAYSVRKVLKRQGFSVIEVPL
tara:strand:+ start:221 stop:388 length:168 start_codon:yes stop_codon:yes gene_type:complete